MRKIVKLCGMASIVILLCTCIFGCLSPGPGTTPRSMEASDGQVTIIINRLERSDTIPADVAEELDDIPAPESGNDFILAYITIARIESVHVVDPLGFENREPVLFDSKNHEYEPLTGSIKGVRFTDPQDITSPYEVVEGATGFLMFEIPKAEKPSKINYIYSFKLSWQESAKMGQMDLVLGP